MVCLSVCISSTIRLIVCLKPPLCVALCTLDNIVPIGHHRDPPPPNHFPFLPSLQVERCYYFLQACVETAQRKEPVDGRLVQFLLSNPTNDGGQWDMLVNLIGQFIPVITRSGECCCFVCIMLCHYVVAESRIAPYSLYQVLPWPRGHM